jgi:hypothetical protein
MTSRTSTTCGPVRPNSFAGPELRLAVQIPAAGDAARSRAAYSSHVDPASTTNSQNHLIWTPWCRQALANRSAQVVNGHVVKLVRSEVATSQLSFRRPKLFMTCNYV